MSKTPTTPKPPSKKAVVQTLLERPSGASLAEIAEATGWQNHTIRAHFTRLRQHGANLTREAAEGGTIYRITAVAGAAT